MFHIFYIYTMFHVLQAPQPAQMVPLLHVIMEHVNVNLQAHTPTAVSVPTLPLHFVFMEHQLPEFTNP